METLYKEDGNNNTPEQNRELQKVLSANWKKYPKEFRIAATIHDGQWYTKDKWKKVAKVKSVDDIEEWIINNKNILIQHENGISYRVDKNQVEKWYKENNLDITKELVPKNYPPRIWNNLTETETFLKTPKEVVSSLLLRSYDDKITNKIIKILQPYSQIKIDEHNKIYFYTMNADFLKYKLTKLLTTKELDKCEIRIRHNFKKRELCDFDEEFLIKILEFYYILSITLLKPHQNTMKVFLPDPKDRSAQIYEWIIKALQKFDETAGVPFSGYLASVLNRWPYDLPDNSLGKNMAGYQRKRAKIIKKLGNPDDILVDILKSELNMYSSEEFKEYEGWHQQWLKIQGASNLTWEDKNSEKYGKNITETKSYINYSLKSKVIRTIILSCVKQEKELVAVRILNDLYSPKNKNNYMNIGNLNYIDNELREAISKELKLK